MRHFCVFFDVLAQISAPVARHGSRLWQIKAGAWSFSLPESSLRETRSALGDDQNNFCGNFLGVVRWRFCLDLGASRSPRLETVANESWSLERQYARVSAQENAQAPRNKFCRNCMLLGARLRARSHTFPHTPARTLAHACAQASANRSHACTRLPAHVEPAVNRQPGYRRENS